MRSLRSRLTLTYLAVILLGMGLAAILAWVSVEQLYLETQKANLLAQAQLVATTLQSQALPPISSAGPYSQMANVLPGIHTRLIDEQGAAVIDLQGAASAGSEISLTLPALAQNAGQNVSPAELLSRPEIAQALAGEPATAIRRLTLPGDPRVLYAAAPVWNEAGQVAQVVYVASPLPDTGLTALPVAIRWQLAGAIVLAVALATAAGWWLARRISNPLSHLARSAQAVAAGDLRQAVPEDPAIVELHDLSRAFNTMTASLRQADQLKTAFVADASHELRTPLTAIKGFVETLQDGAMDDLEVRDHFLSSIATETERLIRLVNELLLLTRADAQALNLRLQAFDLQRLAQTRVDYLAPLADQRQVHLRVMGPPDRSPTPVWADPDRVAQILDNLLENAIRHSPPGHEVTVSLSPQGDELACAISDTGSGIPAQHQPFIFERFYRADAARSRHSGNSGLGLAIARALVLAQQGRITVQSQEGEGTTLTFVLPCSKNCL